MPTLKSGMTLSEKELAPRSAAEDFAPRKFFEKIRGRLPASTREKASSYPGAASSVRDRKTAPDLGQLVVLAVAFLFFAITSWTSYAHWANYQYRTFDLAYYVQGLWQLMHGRMQVSVEEVPLLGNHVEPVIFLFLPLFALFQHPMLFVLVQNALLAAMGPVAYRISNQLELPQATACLLAVALLLTPATSYVALHEFHPEALTAPFLLLLLEARIARSLARHWLWFVAVLSCKENMALLLIAYCAMSLVTERRSTRRELFAWYLWPMTLAFFWFLFSILVITPSLNGGQIDYGSLYSRLGNSPGEILTSFVTRPHRVLGALVGSLAHGNLVWALLLPFLGLPLLKPRWLLVALPVLLQHLLSWRSSEWNIYFHYAAPLLPLFWIATVQAIALKPLTCMRNYLSMAILLSCTIAQITLGPAAGILQSVTSWNNSAAERAEKNALLSRIPDNASVLAPLPYLSHLALRENLYSLHYVLKGLKTLSRHSYSPPAPADFVLIDTHDDATFDAGAGYYHPTMRTTDGRIIPSSDALLSSYLARAQWSAHSREGVTLLTRTGTAPAESRP